VRTAIEGEKQQADDGALFAGKMLVPHGLEWLGRVDGSGLSAKATGQLEALLEFGVEPLGKTKARGAVTLSAAARTEVTEGELFQVTLETAGLLLSPERVLGSGAEAAMRAGYGAFFAELSKGALQLDSYFQRVSLAGGEYMRRRFQMPTPYRPFLLTNAGSSFLLRAATMDTGLLGHRRNLSMPGVSVTVGEQIEALRRVAGDAVAARIRREPDPAIVRIVDGWPRNFDARRARDLGFAAEDGFEAIIRAHVEDELGGGFVGADGTRVRL
jgi:hypothetical protein